MALTKIQKETLRQLRERCAFADANFGFAAERVVVHGGVDDGKDEDLDTFVKQETRAYRETWILPLLDALIAEDTRLLRELID